jgi:hypothetical protein
MGITEETLRITNELVYKGKNDARQLKGDLKTTKTEAKKTGVSMEGLAKGVGLATAAFGTAAVATKVLYDTIKAGAQIEAAALTFDSLTASVGSTSEAMLGDLKTATDGMISNLDLMRSANQFVAMGLATTSEEAATLAEVGSTLGAAFRGDAVAGMEEFSLLLANQSIPRLDSFGISAGAVRTRIAELVAETPNMTREAAFMQAVMEEAETTMGKLGDQSGSTATQIAILEATMKDIKDEASKAAAEGAGPLLESINDLLAVFLKVEDSVDTAALYWRALFLLLESGVDTITDLVSIFKDDGFWAGFTEWWESTNTASDGLKKHTALTQSQFYAQQALNEETDTAVYMVDSLYRSYNPFTKKLTELTAEQIEHNKQILTTRGLIPRWRNLTDDMADSHDQLEGAVQNTTGAVEQFGEMVGYAAVRQQLLDERMLAAEESTRRFNAQIGDLFVEAAEAGIDATIDINQELYNLVGAGDASGETMAGLAVALGIMSAAEAEAFLKTAILRGELQLLAEDVIAGKVSAEEAAAAAEAMALGYANSAAQALILAENARLLKLELDKVPRNIVVTIDYQDGGLVVRDADDPSGPGIPENAAGTANWTGGYSMVGEYGPEMVRMPRGAQVVSTNQTHNQTHNTTINGSSRRAERIIQQYIRRESRPKRMG